MLNEAAFLDLDKLWHGILNQFQITPALHMTDFVRPYGKHIGLYPELKLCLFRKVVEVINSHKIYSFHVAVPQADFKSLMPMDVYRNICSPYAMAFLTSVMMHQMFCERQLPKWEAIVSYVVDAGSPYEDQLHSAHKCVLEWQERFGRSAHTGAMTTDRDDRVTALQAADVIAWSAHRLLSGGLVNEFEPLRDLLPEPHPPLKPGFHWPFEIPFGGIELLADFIKAWLSSGKNPKSLDEMILPRLAN